MHYRPADQRGLGTCRAEVREAVYGMPLSALKARHQADITGGKSIMMTIQGICPKCGKRVLHVNVETVVGMVDGVSKSRCISHSCIHCHVVLGVQIDHRAKPRPKSKPAPQD